MGLDRFLTQKQLGQYVRFGAIAVKGSEGNWFIIPDRAGPRSNGSGEEMISMFDGDGKPIAQLCVGVRAEAIESSWENNVVNMLAIKMNLEADEKSVLEHTEEYDGPGDYFSIEDGEEDSVPEFRDLRAKLERMRFW